MDRAIASLIAVVFVFGLLTTISYGQLDGLYEFDGGGDGTSWDDATNWEQVLDSNGNPISGDPATPPSSVTSADIPLLGVVIDSTMPGQTALDTRIGTANGAGSLNISGGDLTLRDLFVGSSGNAGTLDVSGGTLTAGDDITIGDGSPGTMTISDGAVSTSDDFLVNANSSLAMTGGTLFVGDRLITADSAILLNDGGEIIVDDDFFFFGDPQMTVDSGSMIAFDKLRFDDDTTRNGKLTINGGVVRSNEFGFVDGLNNHILRGVVEINGDGVYQVEAPSDMSSPISQLSVALAQILINDGIHFTTTEVGPRELVASSVVVPEFDGRRDVIFTQISLQDRVPTIPEPLTTTLGVMGLGVLGMATRRRAA